MKGDKNLGVDLGHLCDVAIWEIEEDKCIFSGICYSANLPYLVDRLTPTQGIRIIKHYYEEEN